MPEKKKTSPRLCAALLAALMLLSGSLGMRRAAAQTGIAMSSPEALAKTVAGKSEIERLIVLGTPTSLAAAIDAVRQSKVVSEEDKAALLEIVRGVSYILYPTVTRTDSPARAAATKSQDPTQPQGFYLDNSLKNIDRAYSLVLTQLVEACQGKVFAAPRGAETSVLAELLPALAIFCSQDKDTARASAGYAERFESIPGQVSVIPALVRARYEKIAGDRAKAEAACRTVLASYPDVWPARLELGTLLLDSGSAAEALAVLSPLAETRQRDSSVVKAYSLALYRNDLLSDAEPWLRKALETEPDSPDLMLAIAHILLDRNEYIAAQPLLDLAGRKKPGDRMYLYLKTILSKGQNRNDEALKWARKGLAAYPTDPEMMVLLARVLYSGDESGHSEASLLCREALKPPAASAGVPAQTPLQIAMHDESLREASRLLLMESYRHQDWFAAASLLESTSTAGLDKSVVATILRRSGRSGEAVSFTSQWYRESPGSDAAAEAYLRSLASTVNGIASAGAPVSDVAGGLLGANSAQASAGGNILQAPLVALAIQILSTTSSSSLRSYLNYLQGSLQASQDAAIDFYRMALIERADNIEAIAALAKIYAGRKDSQKALSYIRQAKAIGVTDLELATQLKDLEKSLTQG